MIPADKILAQLDIDFSDLAPDLQDQLKDIAKEGIMGGAAQISIT